MHDGPVHRLQDAAVSFTKSCLPCRISRHDVALNVQPLQNHLELAFELAAAVVMKPLRRKNFFATVMLDFVFKIFATW